MSAQDMQTPANSKHLQQSPCDTVMDLGVSCSKNFASTSFRSEWGVNQARDSYASYVGHYPMLSYFAVAENESIARVKFNIAEVRSMTTVPMNRYR